ncbi:hypothetical protein A6R68_07331, partial [Neotoma lepida]
MKKYCSCKHRALEAPVCQKEKISEITALTIQKQEEISETMLLSRFGMDKIYEGQAEVTGDEYSVESIDG